MRNFTKERRELVAAGWRREDRHNQERWAPPWSGIGFAPELVTYRTARRRYLADLRAREQARSEPKDGAR